MKSEIKESISRILLIVYWVMLVISFFILAPAGVMLGLHVCVGFFPVLALFFGVEKHRKYICLAFTVILLLVMADHIANQKRNSIRMDSCYKKIEELEKKLNRYEKQDNKIPTEASN